MKWYWILLIVTVAIVAGILIWKAVSPSKSASSPATTTLAVTPSTTVANGNGSTVATTTNPDGTKTVAISKAA